MCMKGKLCPYAWLSLFLCSRRVELSLTQRSRRKLFISFPQKLMDYSRRSCKLFLVIVWLTGFGSGIYTAAHADSLISLMRACCDAGVSIVGLLFVPFFPFLISAYAVYFSQPWLLRAVAFIKSFLFACCSCIVLKAFGAAGWLLWPMLQFTDLMTLPLLCRFQIRHFRERAEGFYKDAVLTLLWFCGIALADWLWVAPMLRDII